MVPVFYPSSPLTSTYPINIDGVFTDWDDFTDMSSSVDEINPNIDIISAAIAENADSFLSFYIEVDGDILEGEDISAEGLADIFHILIDSDVDPDTGYYVNGIGADFMMEISGWNGNVLQTTQHSFSSDSDPNDWTGFNNVGTGKAVANGSMLETQIPWSSLLVNHGTSITALVHSQSYDGWQDFSDCLISNGLASATLTHQDVTSEILSGNSNDLLDMTFMGKCNDTTIENIIITLVGTARPSDLSGVSLVNSNGQVLSTANPAERMSFSLTDQHLTEGNDRTYTIRADIASGAVDGRTLGC